MTNLMRPEAYRQRIRTIEVNPKKIESKINDQYHRYARRELGLTKMSDMTIEKRGIVSPHPCLDLKSELDLRSKEPYLIGCELEIEHGRHNIGDIKDKLGELLKPFSGEYYACTDGSLHNGVEIVFAPRSIKEWQSRYTKLLILLKGLVKLGFISHDSGRCGLHFHVSRKGLARERWLQLGRLVCSNKSFFAKISRRDGNNQYCKFIRSQTDRYTAINYTNSNTIEFRFFRGTLSIASFIASLETVIGLVNYHDNDKKRLGIIGLRKYIENSPNLKHAAKYLLPHWPTPQERKKYSEEERDIRRLERARRKSNRLAQLTSYLDALARNAESRCANTMLRHSRINDTIIQVPVPVRLHGFNRTIQAHVANNYTPIAYVMAPSSIDPILIKRAKTNGISIRHSHGWGRSNTSYNLSIY